MTRILIADDHPVVRRGLKQILDEEPTLRVEGEAGSAGEVLQLLEQGGWDVVVLDLSMPGARGLELLERVLDRSEEAGVLVLSIHSEEQYAVRCLRAGALGYLSKQSAPENLAEAVRLVAAGRRYLSPQLAERLVQQARGEDEGLPHEMLSEREKQVMRRLASGETVSQIAAELELSVKTVSTYRARLLEKMGLQSNADLTRYAIEHGLV
ncbi:MAG TPA: response regulator transcription factor [Thermoanaerobaculia bacterium]|nr:response regulator transcription factor [Thermoanaerobaculia bacterium]